MSIPWLVSQQQQLCETKGCPTLHGLDTQLSRPAMLAWCSVNGTNKTSDPIPSHLGYVICTSELVRIRDKDQLSMWMWLGVPSPWAGVYTVHRFKSQATIQCARQAMPVKCSHTYMLIAVLNTSVQCMQSITGNTQYVIYSVCIYCGYMTFGNTYLYSIMTHADTNHTPCIEHHHIQPPPHSANCKTVFMCMCAH